MKRYLRSKNIERACRWLVAIVFIYAGVPKLFNLNSFAEVIGAYGLLPEQLLYPAAFVIALAEVVCGVGLILKNRFSIHVITLLLLLFVAVLSYGLALGLDVDCGCFGPGDPEKEVFSNLKTALVRDLLLIIPLGFIYYRLLLESKVLERKR